MDTVPTDYDSLHANRADCFALVPVYIHSGIILTIILIINDDLEIYKGM